MSDEIHLRSTVSGVRFDRFYSQATFESVLREREEQRWHAFKSSTQKDKEERRERRARRRSSAEDSQGTAATASPTTSPSTILSEQQQPKFPTTSVSRSSSIQSVVSPRSNKNKKRDSVTTRKTSAASSTRRKSTRRATKKKSVTGVIPTPPAVANINNENSASYLPSYEIVVSDHSDTASSTRGSDDDVSFSSVMGSDMSLMRMPRRHSLPDFYLWGLAEKARKPRSLTRIDAVRRTCLVWAFLQQVTTSRFWFVKNLKYFMSSLRKVQRCVRRYLLRRQAVFMACENRYHFETHRTHIVARKEFGKKGFVERRRSRFGFAEDDFSDVVHRMHRWEVLHGAIAELYFELRRNPSKAAGTRAFALHTLPSLIPDTAIAEKVQEIEHRHVVAASRRSCANLEGLDAEEEELELQNTIEHDWPSAVWSDASATLWCTHVAHNNAVVVPKTVTGSLPSRATTTDDRSKLFKHYEAFKAKASQQRDSTASDGVLSPSASASSPRQARASEQRSTVVTFASMGSFCGAAPRARSPSTSNAPLDTPSPGARPNGGRRRSSTTTANMFGAAFRDIFHRRIVAERALEEGPQQQQPSERRVSDVSDDGGVHTVPDAHVVATPTATSLHFGDPIHPKQLERSHLDRAMEVPTIPILRRPADSYAHRRAKYYSAFTPRPESSRRKQWDYKAPIPAAPARPSSAAPRRRGSSPTATTTPSSPYCCGRSTPASIPLQHELQWVPQGRTSPISATAPPPEQQRQTSRKRVAASPDARAGTALAAQRQRQALGRPATPRAPPHQADGLFIRGCQKPVLTSHHAK
eukprot:PhM_4_TR9226/c0_g1_i1/m.20776